MRKNLLFRLIFSLFLGFIYFFVICILRRSFFKDVLYYFPRLSLIMALINSCLVFLSAYFINKKVIKLIFKNKIKMLALLIAFLLITSLPIMFLRNCTIADEFSIRKINANGKITEKYDYADIDFVEVSIRYGLQFYICFNNGKNIFICSHELNGLNNFRDSSNIIKFYELMLNKPMKIHYEDSWRLSSYGWSKSDKEAINYFEKVFQKTGDGSKKTGDGSVS